MESDPPRSLTPSREEFRRLAREGNLIPVYAELPADLETPLSAFLRIGQGPYAFLLESVEGGEKWARYSFLGTHPHAIFRAKGHRVVLWERGRGTRRFNSTDPLGELKKLLAPTRPVSLPALPRFVGGAVGYLSYDMVRFFERLPSSAPDDLGLPDACFLLTDTLVAFDNLRHRLLVIANARLEGQDLDRAYDDAAERIRVALRRLGRPLRHPPPLAFSPQSLLAPGEEAFASTLDEEGFMRAVERAKEHIAAGDIFQVVLSRRLETALRATPFQIYRALRTINPSPYLFFLRLGRLTIVGSSPEVLVRLEDGNVELRPIAGTRPRGGTPVEDHTLESELLADPKERAEHVMLVDLGRNDVGRVATVGSVEVTEFMTVERYSHVMHLVSNVRGRLREGLDAFDVLRACFPAGTVTGAPKIRSMEIIEDLEPVRRGPYAGAVGYVSYTGALDSCITIRTILCTQDQVFLQAGAGIVADSDPKREYMETANKARGLILAIRMAEQSR